MRKYESYRSELVGLFESCLVSSPTVGQEYTIRTVLLRLWNQVFKTVKGSRIIAESLDSICWDDNLDNIKNLILTLDNCLVIATEHRIMQLEVPERDIVAQILAKTQFLGSTISALVKSSRLDLYPNADLCYPLELLGDIDWQHLAHLTVLDVDVVTFFGFADKLQYYDFPPTNIEKAIQVSLT